jgi:hypothetical protein
MNFLHAAAYAVLNVLDKHFGALVAIALGIYLVVAYWRGELKDFFTFARQALSTRLADGTWIPSTKSIGYFMGAATICWSFAKITLAVCRRIDAPKDPLDPTLIFVTELGVIATLVGVMYLGGKALAAKFIPIDQKDGGDK